MEPKFQSQTQTVELNPAEADPLLLAEQEQGPNAYTPTEELTFSGRTQALDSAREHGLFDTQETPVIFRSLTAELDEQEKGLLLNEEEVGLFESRWRQIQIGFVDEPRKAVEMADQLIQDAVTRISEIFAAERDKLEQEWSTGETASTEDLRVALRRYRSFMARLLSV